MPLWSVNRHRQSSSRSNDSLRFRHRPYAFDTSIVVPLRSSSCLSPDLVLARPFPSVLTTMAFDHSRRRWFGTCPCRPVPRGLPSSVKQLRTTQPFGLSRSWRTVVGIADQLASALLQFAVEVFKKEVGEQRRNRRALGNAPPQGAHMRSIPEAGLDPEPQHSHDGGIRPPFRQTLQKQIVVHIRKKAFNISIHDEGEAK